VLGNPWGHLPQNMTSDTETRGVRLGDVITRNTFRAFLLTAPMLD
jgi:hypothetical protein